MYRVTILESIYIYRYFKYKILKGLILILEFLPIFKVTLEQKLLFKVYDVNFVEHLGLNRNYPTYIYPLIKRKDGDAISCCKIVILSFGCEINLNLISNSLSFCHFSPLERRQYVWKWIMSKLD